MAILLYKIGDSTFQNENSTDIFESKTASLFIVKSTVGNVELFIYFFHHTLAESTTFAPGSKTRMWYFRPGYGEIVYYAPREEKTWTDHSS